MERRDEMNAASQPPDNNIQHFINLAQALRTASGNRDFAALGQLLAENLRPDLVDTMVYVRPQVGHLTLVAGFMHLWMPPLSGVVAREPTLEEMAVVLQAASR
jgi:hypothetical protein